jgi:hypothetical protein
MHKDEQMKACCAVGLTLNPDTQAIHLVNWAGQAVHKPDCPFLDRCSTTTKVAVADDLRYLVAPKFYFISPFSTELNVNYPRKKRKEGIRNTKQDTQTECLHCIPLSFKAMMTRLLGKHLALGVL